jgi:NAD(P)-dependent dehydrogenase (short-subunit alcohol dehydrogenase family)
MTLSIGLAMILKGKNIIVIGSNGLIGRSIVSELLKQEAVVFGWDITLPVEELLVSKNFHFSQLDIADFNQIEDAVDSLNNIPSIDGIVNSSYLKVGGYGCSLDKVTLKDFQDNISFNVSFFFSLIRAFEQKFISQGHGNIIMFSSVYSIIAPKFELYEDLDMTMPIQYAAYKSSINSLVKYYAKFYKGKNIRFNAVLPGGIYDGQNDLFVSRYNESCLNKGLLDPEDIVGTVVFLLSDMSKYINGQNIIIDDGFTL